MPSDAPTRRPNAWRLRDWLLVTGLAAVALGGWSAISRATLRWERSDAEYRFSYVDRRSIWTGETLSREVTVRGGPFLTLRQTGGLGSSGRPHGPWREELTLQPGEDRGPWVERGYRFVDPMGIGYRLSWRWEGETVTDAEYRSRSDLLSNRPPSDL